MTSCLYRSSHSDSELPCQENVPPELSVPARSPATNTDRFSHYVSYNDSCRKDVRYAMEKQQQRYLGKCKNIWRNNDIIIIIIIIIIKNALMRLLLKWHCHIKDVAGALYRIYAKHVLNTAMSDCQHFVKAAMASDQSKNDSRNRCAFVSLWNCSSELAALVAGGKLFQDRAAATWNARSPREERRVDGTSSVVVLVGTDDGLQVRRHILAWRKGHCCMKQ